MLPSNSTAGERPFGRASALSKVEGLRAGPCFALHGVSTPSVRTSVLPWVVACPYYTQQRHSHKRTLPTAPLLPSRPAAQWGKAAPHERADAVGAVGAVRQTTVSHHLKVLRDRGLVTATREGNAVRYALRDHRIIQALDLLRAVMADVLAERAKLAGAIAQ